MIKVIVTGHLGKDCEVRHQSGFSVINFSLASTEKWKDKNGQPQSKTTWFDCAVFKRDGGSLAIADYLKKGTMVLVEGKPDARSWIDEQNMVSRHVMKIEVKNLELLGAAKPTERTPASGDLPNSANETEGFSDNDLPF